MVPKLLVFMAAVVVLERVAGIPDKQLANGTQSKVNLGRGKPHKGRRLDKLACQIFHGSCQNLDDNCDGQLEEGPEWCLHSRHFGCCILRSCSLNGVAYRNGAIAEDRCITLKCSNGEWLFNGLSNYCSMCYAFGMTNIVPYVNVPYPFPGDEGAYVFSQYGLSSDAPFGIEITFVSISPDENCIECILYYESGVIVEICFSPYETYPSVCVNYWCFGVIPSPGIVQIIFPGPVYIIFSDFGIYIIGSQGLSVYVTWIPIKPGCSANVFAFSSRSLYYELYGLCDVWIPIPLNNVPLYYTMLNGGETTEIDEFVRSWQLPLRRKLIREQRKNPSSSHTGQVTDQPIIERSMSDIEQLCKEIYKGPCSILPYEECEKIMEDCVSRIRNASKPGQGIFSDSTE